MGTDLLQYRVTRAHSSRYAVIVWHAVISQDHLSHRRYDHSLPHIRAHARCSCGSYPKLASMRGKSYAKRDMTSQFYTGWSYYSRAFWERSGSFQSSKGGGCVGGQISLWPAEADRGRSPVLSSGPGRACGFPESPRQILCMQPHP